MPLSLSFPNPTLPEESGIWGKKQRHILEGTWGARSRASEDGWGQWVWVLGSRHWAFADVSLAPSQLCATGLDWCSATGAWDIGHGLSQAPVLSRQEALT